MDLLVEDEDDDEGCLLRVQEVPSKVFSENLNAAGKKKDKKRKRNVTTVTRPIIDDEMDSDVSQS
jgi:hypothetical protein